MRSLAIMGAIVILVLAALVWAIIQWNECRSMDFSVLYCIAHIS